MIKITIISLDRQFFTSSSFFDLQYLRNSSASSPILLFSCAGFESSDLSHIDRKVYRVFLIHFIHLQFENENVAYTDLQEGRFVSKDEACYYNDKVVSKSEIGQRTPFSYTGMLRSITVKKCS